MNFSFVDINSRHGEIKLGPFRLHWFNPDGNDDPGFTILSFRETNVEFGQVDQDRPGIYLTRYDQGEVIPTRTLLTL